MSLHRWDNHVKPEDLNLLYSKDLPVEPGYYYVAVLNEWGQFASEYHETVFHFSGPYDIPEVVEDDDLPYWEGEWWWSENCITNRGMLREINGVRKYLVGPKVVTIQELQRYQNLIMDEMVKTNQETGQYDNTNPLDEFYCDGSLGGFDYETFKEKFKR